MQINWKQQIRIQENLKFKIPDNFGCPWKEIKNSFLCVSRVLSEPYSLTSVHGLYTQKRIPKVDYERLVKNLLLLLIASEVSYGRQKKFSRIVIKVKLYFLQVKRKTVIPIFFIQAPPWCAPQMGLIGDRLPWIKQVCELNILNIISQVLAKNHSISNPSTLALRQILIYFIGIPTWPL